MIKKCVQTSMPLKISGNIEAGDIRGMKMTERLEEELPKQFGTDERCGKCGSELVFDHTSDKGTIIEFCADRHPNPRTVNQRVIRNATMSFLWVYFKCPKCGWILGKTSKSKGVFVVKSDKPDPRGIAEQFKEMNDWMRNVANGCEEYEQRYIGIPSPKGTCKLTNEPCEFESCPKRKGKVKNHG